MEFIFEFWVYLIVDEGVVYIVVYGELVKWYLDVVYVFGVVDCGVDVFGDVDDV